MQKPTFQFNTLFTHHGLLQYDFCFWNSKWNRFHAFHFHSAVLYRCAQSQMIPRSHFNILHLIPYVRLLRSFLRNYKKAQEWSFAGQNLKTSLLSKEVSLKEITFEGTCDCTGHVKRQLSSLWLLKWSRIKYVVQILASSSHSIFQYLLCLIKWKSRLMHAQWMSETLVQS